MKYDKIVEAIFIERPNRFIARVKIDGAEEVELVHVKNTGRCRELLLPGAEVILEDCIEKNPNRKTRYDLIGGKPAAGCRPYKDKNGRLQECALTPAYYIKYVCSTEPAKKNYGYGFDEVTCMITQPHEDRKY